MSHIFRGVAADSRLQKPGLKVAIKLLKVEDKKKSKGQRGGGCLGIPLGVLRFLSVVFFPVLCISYIHFFHVIKFLQGSPMNFSS